VGGYGAGSPGRRRNVSAEENKAIVRRFFEECWNGHNPNVVDEVVSPDYFNHAAAAEHQHGTAGAKHILNWLMAAFPDTRFDIEDIIAEGDMVSIRGTASGTHEGEELWGIPPTGKRFAVQQAHWVRVADGKLAEHWAVRDDLSMMRQLGATST
jgi:predicted ester cyclase